MLMTESPVAEMTLVEMAFVEIVLVFRVEAVAMAVEMVLVFRVDVVTLAVEIVLVKNVDAVRKLPILAYVLTVRELPTVA